MRTLFIPEETNPVRIFMSLPPRVCRICGYAHSCKIWRAVGDDFEIVKVCMQCNWTWGEGPIGFDSIKRVLNDNFDRWFKRPAIVEPKEDDGLSAVETAMMLFGGTFIKNELSGISG